MMNVNHTRLLLVAMTMFSLPSVFAAQNLVCGPDPAKNTKVLQDAINRAKPIDTLVKRGHTLAFILDSESAFV
jgi:hypothetical protein